MSLLFTLIAHFSGDQGSRAEGRTLAIAKKKPSRRKLVLQATAYWSPAHRIYSPWRAEFDIE
jgi:hypothetical protein